MPPVSWLSKLDAWSLVAKISGIIVLVLVVVLGTAWGVDVADCAARNLNVNRDQRSKSENYKNDDEDEDCGMKRAKGTVNVKGANAPSISMTPVARHSNAPPASMRRRLPQHKGPDCPATILFRYSDRQTIRIYEASGEGQLYRLFLQGTTSPIRSDGFFPHKLSKTPKVTEIHTDL